ncbi:hypothetical protein VOLCADRAFT_119651, partial [Volvox carteri f. nagariensis]
MVAPAPPGRQAGNAGTAGTCTAQQQQQQQQQQPVGARITAGDATTTTTITSQGEVPSGTMVSEDRLMEGKYCIVTGANSGIGLQVARGLMRRGAHVVMACRNMATCEEAAAALRAEGLAGSCACRAIDLELRVGPRCPYPQDFSSIRAFVRQQSTELSAGTATPGRGPGQPRHVDVLVNNAGVMGVSPANDGSDRHLTANHLGPYLLTRLLLPHMTHGSRIVNVASRAHYGGSLSLVSGPHGAKAIRNDTHHWWWQYARSKLCNVLFTAELQRRYGHGYGNFSPTNRMAASPDDDDDGGGGGGGGSGLHSSRRGIGAYAVSPGMVDTGIFRYLLPAWAHWLKTPLRPFFRTPQQGAEVVVFAASDPELEGRDALFLHDCREMTPS